MLVLKRVSRFLRLAAAGATVAIPLLGTVTALDGNGLGLIAGVACVGLAHHVFSFVLNDVVDLPIDRTEPRRSPSPLVQGLISRRFAVAVAISAGLFGFALSALLGASPRAQILLLCSYVFIAAYDIWGKRTPVPPLIDGVQGVGWALLAWYGAEVAGGATAVTGLLALFLVGYITLANGVHGGLRDLENDRARGARTTAIFLEAMPLPGGSATCSRALRRYAFTLETWNALVVGVMIPTLGYQGWTMAYAVAAWLVLAAVSRRLLHKGLDDAPDRRTMMLLGTSHLIVSFAIVVSVLLPVAPPAIAVFVLVVYVSPLLAYGWLFDAVLRVPDPRSAR